MQLAQATTELTSPTPSTVTTVSSPLEAQPETEAHTTAEATQSGGLAAGAKALGLDGKLLAAQIVNFIILVLVLRQFVYKPLIGLLEKRRQTIEESLTKAETIEKQAADFAVEHEKRINESKAEAANIIDSAKSAAESMKNDIQAKAQSEADRILTKAQEEIANQKEQMLTELKHEVGTLVVAATGKILGKELDQKTQSRLIEEALGEVKVKK